MTPEELKQNAMLEEAIASAELAPTRYGRCAECNNPFEPHHWRYGQKGKLWHTNCFLKDNTRVLAMVKSAVERERGEIIETILSAGENNISMLDNSFHCQHCLRGFTGTYWISQNDLIFHLTEKYLDEYKKSIERIKNKV